jgi:predicted amidohydrolase YtcJ
MAKRGYFPILILALLAWRPVLAQTLPAELIRYPETILHNGKVVTMDNKTTATSPGTISQALALRDGKILAHGANGKILGLKGPKTEVIDLKGRTVVPGIIDTHYHAMEYTMDHWGRSVPELRKPTVKGRTWEELRKGALEAAAKEAQSAKAGQWIWVRLPNRVLKDGKQIDIKVAMTDLKMFNKEELDKISRDQPIFIQAGNRGLFSSKAIESFKNYYGALDEEISEDGIVWSASIRRSLQTDIILDGKLGVLADLYKKEQEELAAYGVTTWSSSTSALNTVRAYRLLDQKGEMVVRFAYGLGSLITGTSQGPAMVRGYMELMEGQGSEFLWPNGISLVSADGSYPQLKSIADAPAEIKSREMSRLDAGDYRRKVLEEIVARGARFSNTHVAGDFTLDQVMDIIETGSKKAGMSPQQIQAQRHTVDHCTMNPRPDQMPRLKQLGIMVSCSPKYIENASPEILRDYGEKYLNWVAPVKSLIDAGVKTVLETDIHYTPTKGPFYYLELLVTRNVNGKVYAGREKIDRVTALKMATAWASEYVLKEKVLGTLEPGKLADLLVLNRDYFTVPEGEIGTVAPVLTMVGGKIVSENAALRGKTHGPQVAEFGGKEAPGVIE